MHYITDSQKNTYLKEISGLAKAIKNNPALGELSNAKELGEVRSRLIDLLTAAVESALPDVKARMIQLEAKHAVSAYAETLPAESLSLMNLIPLSVVIVPGAPPLVLSQDKEIIPLIESAADIAGPLASRAPFDRAGYRILTRSVSAFRAGQASLRLPRREARKRGAEKVEARGLLLRGHRDCSRAGEILLLTLLHDSVVRKLSSISASMRRNFGHGMARVSSPGRTHGRADTSNMPRTALG